MKVHHVVVTMALVSLAVAGAIPKPGEHKERVIDKELSDEKHFGEDDEHNPEYDHEAFLGKEEARDFEDLSPEESKERLAKIFDKIDKDDDGKVSEEELRNWIKYVQNKYIIEDTERQWKEHNIDEGGHLTWVKYKERTYGYLENEKTMTGPAFRNRQGGVTHEVQMKDTDDDESHYKDMVDRDQRRWKRADKDSDGNLSKEEFTDFLHPEEADHMKDIVVEETLEDIDKNKDGFISEEEYIGDFYPDSEDGEPEPDWVKTEREAFHKDHDKNGDGKMDSTEIMSWIIPDDYDHTVAETQHLLQEADGDKDGFLSKEEVVDKYDLFVGSQATDFGEALTRHDEF